MVDLLTIIEVNSSLTKLVQCMCNQMLTSEIREQFHVHYVQIQSFRQGKSLGCGQLLIPYTLILKNWLTIHEGAIKGITF